MIHSNGQRTTHNGRPGFTLIELLVVIAIIGILVALSASAIVRYLGVQQRNNTEVMIRKVNPELKSQWMEVVKQANKEDMRRFDPPNGPYPIYNQVLSMAGGDERRARVIWIKLRLRQEFPISYGEVLNPAPLPPIPEYRQAVVRATGGTPPASTGPTESAACLLLALTKARGGKVLDASTLGSNAVMDTNGDGLQEIVDAWGQPVLFIRFPWRSPDLNPDPNPNPSLNYPQTAPQAGLKDSIDPEGLLTSPSWLGQPGSPTAERRAFTNLLHPVPDHSNGVRSFNLIPVIVSAGPNRAMGIDPTGWFQGNFPPPAPQPQPPPPPDPREVNNAADNIHSYVLDRLEARGE